MEQTKNISRRSFLGKMGAATLVTTGLSACGPREQNNTNPLVPEGEMTYRVNPTTGDKVSLLGFGMMRLPSVGGRSAREGNEPIDQEMVNRMVDYAIEHGVNYFDTSPAYCRGLSERATGIALARHPREKLFIATKLSNFNVYTREASMEMYQKSFEELQTDYIDYYLLHSIGGGTGMQTLRDRYIDNGMLT